MIFRVIRLKSALNRSFAIRTFATKPLTGLFDRGFVKEVFPPDARFVSNKFDPICFAMKMLVLPDVDKKNLLFL